MQINFQNESTIFLIFILIGVLISIIFDLFRAYRKVQHSNDIATYIQDIIFWIISGIIVIYSVFVFNYGQIRGYVILGISLRNFCLFFDN